MDIAEIIYNPELVMDRCDRCGAPPRVEWRRKDGTQCFRFCDSHSRRNGPKLLAGGWTVWNPSLRGRG